MEASAIPASVGLTRTRIAIGAPLLRIRSDEQLVSLFRTGNEEAFRAIHDRYRHRLFVYTRQMLAGSAADAEDAVQEIFVRAYAGLRASDRQLALRAWLYRIAHNRCVDELRRPYPVATEAVETTATGPAHDPVACVEQRDALRRLIDDVRRLPEQQRSALLMRELGGMPYTDISGALAVSVPAVKSLLVRARVGLAQASEARDVACAAIREDLILSHDRGVRTSGLARRHIRDCPSCRQFRVEVRGVSRQFAALVPTLGPAGVIAKLLGIGSGSGAAASGVTGGGAAAAGGAAGTGAVASIGALASAGHVVTLLAAAVVTAGGAIELQHSSSPPAPHRAAHHRVAHSSSPAPLPGQTNPVGQSVAASGAMVATVAPTDADATPSVSPSTSATTPVHRHRILSRRASDSGALPISETADPDHLSYNSVSQSSAIGAGDPTTAAGTSPAATTPTAAPGSSSATAPTSATTPAPETSTDLAGTGTATGTGSSGTTTSAGTPAATGGTSTGSTGSGSSTATNRSGTSSGTSRQAPTGSGRSAVFTVTSAN